MVSDPIEVNWFAASNSLGAFDIVISEMMGCNWKKVGHLKKAVKYRLIPKKEDINVIGDIEFLKKKFVLKRELWNQSGISSISL